jgi:hypothetical protein
VRSELTFSNTLEIESLLAKNGRLFLFFRRLLGKINRKYGDY